MDRPNTHNTIICMKDGGEIWLNLRYTLDRIYLTSILVQYIQKRLHNDDSGVV